MCTRAALRAPPLRLPALRALPPLMLMMRPARRLHERDDSAGTAQRPYILHVEILQQILVDNGFDRAGRGGRTPWRGPAVNQDVQATQLLCRLGDHAVHLLLAGDIGCKRNDAPVRLSSQLSRRRLQIHLVPGYDRHIGPFASQFPRDGFANAPTTASHDRMLVLQSEVHGTLSPWQRDRDSIASLLIVLPERTRRKGCQTQDDVRNVPTCLRQCRRRSSTMRGTHPIPKLR
jgi:hypothetical protein